MSTGLLFEVRSLAPARAFPGCDDIRVIAFYASSSNVSPYKKPPGKEFEAYFVGTQEDILRRAKEWGALIQQRCMKVYKDICPNDEQSFVDHIQKLAARKPFARSGTWQAVVPETCFEEYAGMVKAIGLRKQDMQSQPGNYVGGRRVIDYVVPDQHVRAVIDFIRSNIPTYPYTLLRYVAPAGDMVAHPPESVGAFA